MIPPIEAHLSDFKIENKGPHTHTASALETCPHLNLKPQSFRSDHTLPSSMGTTPHTPLPTSRIVPKRPVPLGPTSPLGARAPFLHHSHDQLVGPTNFFFLLFLARSTDPYKANQHPFCFLSPPSLSLSLCFFFFLIN